MESDEDFGERFIRENSNVIDVGGDRVHLRSVWESVQPGVRLHIEFLIPAKGGNSGVYLQNRYEIQVLDGDSTNHGMAAVINEAAAPYHPYNGVGRWNAYDIVFRAARFTDGR